MKSEISATQFRTFGYNENSKCDTISKASICNYVARNNFIYLCIFFKSATQLPPVFWSNAMLHQNRKAELGTFGIFEFFNNKK